MRVKTLFLACMAVAGSIAAVGSGYQAFSQYREWSASREAARLSDAADAFAVFVERLALERGATNQLLVSEFDPGGRFVAPVTEAVAQSDKSIATMQAALAATGLGANPEVGREIDGYLGKLRQLRVSAQDEGKRPLAQRTPQIGQTYSRALLAISASHSAMLRRLGVAARAFDQQTDGTLDLIELSTSLREAAGGRSTALSQYVADPQKFSADRIAEIDQVSGRIAQMWRMVEATVAEMTPSPALAAALTAARTQFIDENAKTYHELYLAARNGTPPRFNLADWRAWTQVSLKTLPGIRDAAALQMRADSDARIGAARLSFTVALCALVLIVAAMIGTVLLFSRRVVTPLNGLSRTVAEMLAGSETVSMPKRVGMEEIDAIRDGLETFQAHLAKVRELEEHERRQTAERMAHAASMASVVSDVGEVVAAAAAGDFSARLQIDDSDPQMQKLVAGINEINAVVDSATTEFASVLKGVAGGDLTRMVETHYRGRFADLKGAVNETVERLSSTVQTIQITSGEVGVAAREINMGADDLSKRTEEQASSLEETAATTEELAASVKASAQASREAATLADQAMNAAQSGGAIASDAVAAMARIEQASQKISDIIRVIDDIAFQTNLLALNAAVEAARAGDAGKGFAVVASEVRTLAQRSGEAAKDISVLISTSNSEVQDGVKLVRRAGEALTEILQSSRKVSATIADISSAAGEQANGIEEMSQAVAHLDEMTQQNAALAEQSAASAGSLSGRIAELNALVAQFQTGRSPATGFQATPGLAEPTGLLTEPARLRQLAQAALEQPKSTPRPQPQRLPAKKVANGRALDTGWEEF